jgi:hypothetical protein
MIFIQLTAVPPVWFGPKVRMCYLVVFSRFLSSHKEKKRKEKITPVLFVLA